MKIPKFDVYKLGFIIILCTVCFIVTFIILALAFKGIPSNEDNYELRNKLLDLILAMWSTASVILGYNLGRYTKGIEIEEKDKSTT